MKSVHEVRGTGPADAPCVAWGRAPAAPAPALRLGHLVDLGERVAPLGALADDVAALTERARRALGRHLWAALGPPSRVADGSFVLLRIDDPAICALPWQLLRDEATWLHLRGVTVRVQAPGQPASAPYSPTLRVGVVDRAWSPPADLPPLDVLHVVVDPSRQPDHDGAPLALADGVDWDLTALTSALQHQPPKLLILEGAAQPRGGLLRLAARLARHVPCVVVAGDPDLATGARLVQGQFERGLPPAEAARAVEADQSRPSTDWIRVLGGTSAPRPAADERFARWFADDGWRRRLDRRKQTASAMYELARIGRSDATRAGERRDRGLVLVWHGQAASGLVRFLHRIEWELQHEQGVPCALVGMEWPQHPFSTEFDEQVRLRLGAAPGEPDFAAAVAREVPDAPWSAMVLHFDALSPALGPERVSADVLARCVQWWRRKVVASSPARVVPVLALPLLDPSGDLQRALLERLEGWRTELRPARALGLDALSDVTTGDIVDHIEEYRLIDEQDAWQPVADEIMARTSGAYEDTIHLIEQIPWTWRALSSAWERRKHRL